VQAAAAMRAAGNAAVNIIAHTVVRSGTVATADASASADRARVDGVRAFLQLMTTRKASLSLII